MRLKATRKAISPVIATVIIVAVAIAISIAVAGWLFGLWGGFAGGTPQISVTNPTASVGNGTLRFYLVNSGSGSDVLLDIEIVTPNGTASVSAGDLTLQTDIDGNGTAQVPETVPANFEGWVEVTWNTQTPPTALTGVQAGDQVIVKLYFKNSSTQQLPVTLGP